MQQLVTCAFCNAIPATDKARFCGKCGKPLTHSRLAAAQVGSSQTIAPASTTSQITVVTPAFAAPITPTFQHRPRRLLFACTASPIIGLGLGAEPAAIFGLFLTDCGLPEVIVPLGATAAFISLTGFIAYIILSDKISFLNVLQGRRKVESVAPVEAVPPSIAEVDSQTGEAIQFQQERPHQWAQQEKVPSLKL